MKSVDAAKAAKVAKAAKAAKAARNTKRSGLDSKQTNAICRLIEDLFKSGKKSYWSIWKGPQPRDVSRWQGDKGSPWGEPITIRSEEIEIIIRKRRPPGILYTIDNEGKIIGYCD